MPIPEQLADTTIEQPSICSAFRHAIEGVVVRPLNGKEIAARKLALAGGAGIWTMPLTK